MVIYKKICCFWQKMCSLGIVTAAVSESQTCKSESELYKKF